MWLDALCHTMTPTGSNNVAQGQQRAMNTNPYRSPVAVTEDWQPPIRIKAYGLFPMTRRTYLTLQVVMVALLVPMLFAVRPLFARPRSPFHFLDDYFVAILVVTLALEGIETLVMLAKFKKAERKLSQQVETK